MAKGVFADRNGTVYRVQSKGGKVMWQKIEYFPNGSFGTITAVEPGDRKHPWMLKGSALERRLERIEDLLGRGIPTTPTPAKSTKPCRTIDEVARNMLKTKETKARDLRRVNVTGPLFPISSEIVPSQETIRLLMV